mmetsp:Transcript_77815/g.251856  ORF Transcript_77815/g.251856 Transcript_77815/m.251856 type:complete len:222 (-) Transcript_77815:829-1494(-)
MALLDDIVVYCCLVAVHNHGSHVEVRNQPVVFDCVGHLLHHVVLGVGLQLSDFHGLVLTTAEEDAKQHGADNKGDGTNGALSKDEHQRKHELACDADQGKHLQVAHLHDFRHVPHHRHLDLAERELGPDLLPVVQELAQQVGLEVLPQGSPERDVAHPEVRGVDEEDGQAVDRGHHHGRLDHGALDEQRVQHESELLLFFALFATLAAFTALDSLCVEQPR